MTNWRPIESAPLDTVVLLWLEHPLGQGMGWPGFVSEHDGMRSIYHANFVAECELANLSDATLWAPVDPPDGKRFSRFEET